MQLLQTALAADSETSQLEVNGCTINFTTWGKLGLPGIVLIHGSNAHLEWWRVIAPFLTQHFRVCAIDLSGSGQSAWRKQYSGAIFAEEIMAVCQAAKLGAKPYVIGHSFGGFVALETGHLFSDQLGGLIFLDFTVQAPHVENEVLAHHNMVLSQPIRPTRVYKDKRAALARFRLVPEQDCKNPELISYIAEHSVRQVEDGWTWKFDPDMRRLLDIESRLNPDPATKLMGLKCPCAFIMGEHSSDYSLDSLNYTRELTSGRMAMFDIPQTHHHLMFDEPVALITALKNTLLTWETTSP
ncbi:MAG: alpha/beta hydrolase [Pseudomonadales bacterium]|nr:alpha/beta hydrolase [Pseudomonadales bacterium]